MPIAYASAQTEIDAARRWFVPPIVLPLFVMFLIVVRAVDNAFT